MEGSIFINAYWGNISNNTFQKNQMLGGSTVGYSVYSTSNASGDCASGTTSCVTTGTIYKDNIMSKGAYGYVYPAGAPSRTTIKEFSNNSDPVSGAVVATPSYVVPQ